MSARSVSVTSLIAGFMWVMTAVFCAIGFTIGLWHYGEEWARTVGVILCMIGFLHAVVAAVLTLHILGKRRKREVVSEVADVVIAVDRVNRMEDR